MRLDAYSPEPYLRNFSIYMAEKRFGEAEAILLEALRNGVSSGVIYVSLGYLASLTGEHGKAEEYYAVAVEKEPENLMYKFYLGSAQERLGKRKEAIETLEEVVRAEPADLPEAYNYLGYLYVEENKDLDRAIELIKKALEIDPANGAYLDSLGWAYFKKGMLQDALQEMRKAAEVMPQDPVVREHLGDIYYAMGDLAGAAAEWETAAALDPENTAVRVKLENVKAKIDDKL